MNIDTMAGYVSVVVFVVISTAVNDVASEATSPWIQNTVMDHKSKTIPCFKFTIVFIAQTWSFYCGTMSVTSIALVFAQFDLIMIRLVVDLFVNQYTIRRFLLNKSHDHYRYYNEFLNDSETETGGSSSDRVYPANNTKEDSRPGSISSFPVHHVCDRLCTCMAPQTHGMRNGNCTFKSE
jgi:hypothetical protein